jgi:hypothetical protein
MARLCADGHAPEIRHSAYPHTPAVQQCGEDRYHNDADDHWHVIFHSACSGWALYGLRLMMLSCGVSLAE